MQANHAEEMHHKILYSRIVDELGIYLNQYIFEPTFEFRRPERKLL